MRLRHKKTHCGFATKKTTVKSRPHLPRDDTQAKKAD